MCTRRLFSASYNDFYSFSLSIRNVWRPGLMRRLQRDCARRIARVRSQDTDMSVCATQTDHRWLFSCQRANDSRPAGAGADSHLFYIARLKDFVLLAIGTSLVQRHATCIFAVEIEPDEFGLSREVASVFAEKWFCRRSALNQSSLRDYDSFSERFPALRSPGDLRAELITIAPPALSRIKSKDTIR